MHFLSQTFFLLCAARIAFAAAIDCGTACEFVTTVNWPPIENNQFFTQATNGQYAYGYNAPYAMKREIRDQDGVTRGYYTYVDAAGALQTVQYIADVNGFRVTATNTPKNNLAAPKSVTETPEVAAARAQHLAAHKKLKLQFENDNNVHNGNVKEYRTINEDQLINLPKPVEDTAEVAAAKLEFFKRYEAELFRHKVLSL